MYRFGNSIPVRCEKPEGVRLIADHGYGYRAWPYTSLNGETVYTVATSIPGKPPVCKVFGLKEFEKALQIGDLHAFDTRNTSTGQPLITLDNSVLVPVWSVNYYDEKRPWVAIYRFDGSMWSRVYEDSLGSYASHIGQDRATRAIYVGYHQPQTCRSIVLKSVDDGISWSIVYDKVDTSEQNAIVYDAAAYDNKVLVSKRQKTSVLRSIDGGVTWTELCIGSPARSLCMYPELRLTFLTSDYTIYYSRDWGETWKRIRMSLPFRAFRYPIMVGGYLLLSAATYHETVILASKDFYRTVTPVLWLHGAEAPRISGYGNRILIGGERYPGTLIMTSLPETLHSGYSSSIMLWENAEIPVNGAETDFIETFANDKKTFYISSNQKGMLCIQVYDEVVQTYRDIDNVSVSANSLVPYLTSYGARLMRLRFVPSLPARVSAWAVLE